MLCYVIRFTVPAMILPFFANLFLSWFVLSLNRSSCYKQWPGTSVKKVLSDHNVSAMWREGKISNFSYIMWINTLAGRSFNDITQYPVFPWVLSNYSSETIDLKDPANYRDLTKPMGALNEERLQDFLERFNSFVDNTIPPFMYGSHYSTAAGVVLHYNVRLHPFAGLHRQLQGGNFDVSDRLFSSVARTWEMCTSALSEVKELTPEFFCGNGEFLRNGNNFNFGVMQDGFEVDDVVLPPWAEGSPEKFVELNRAALESDFVTKYLPDWIDLIFGYKQRGLAAVANNNVFFYLTYAGSVDLAAIEDEALRKATELQIAHFGQCPMQLFVKPHERRRKYREGPARTFEESLRLWQFSEEEVLEMPFTNAPLTHWTHIGPIPPGPNLPLCKIRFLSPSRIMAIDASGIFSFYNFSWKMDVKAVNEQEARLRSQLLRISEIQRSEAAALAARRTSSQESSGRVSSRGARSSSQDSADEMDENFSFDSTTSVISMSMYTDVDEVNYDLGNFVCARDTSGFKSLPRCPNRTKVVAVSKRSYLGGSAVIVLSDAGNGGLALQFVNVKGGDVMKSQIAKKCFGSGSVSVIDTDYDAASGASEVAAVGCSDGSLCLYTFSESLSTLSQRPSHRIAPFAHAGCEIRGLSVSVALRVVASVSTSKCCLHSITTGKLIGSWGPAGVPTDGYVSEEGVAFSGKVFVSKLGYVVLVVVRGGQKSLQLRSIEGRILGEVPTLSDSVFSIRGECGGKIAAVAGHGSVALYRLSSVKALEVLDVWNVDMGGTVEDLLGLGENGILDVDFGCGSHSSVVAIAMQDGSIRVHALRGIGKWSQSLSSGLGGAVAGLLGKAGHGVGSVGKTVFGGIGSLGKGLFGIGKEIVNEVSEEQVIEEVKKKGVSGFFRRSGSDQS